MKRRSKGLSKEGLAQRALLIFSVLLCGLSLLLGFSALLAPVAKSIVIALAAAALILIVTFTLGIALIVKDGVAHRLMAFIESASANELDLRITQICLGILPYVCVLGLMTAGLALWLACRREGRYRTVTRVLLITLLAVMALLLLLSLVL